MHSYVVSHPWLVCRLASYSIDPAHSARAAYTVTLGTIGKGRSRGGGGGGGGRATHPRHHPSLNRYVLMFLTFCGLTIISISWTSGDDRRNGDALMGGVAGGPLLQKPARNGREHTRRGERRPSHFIS